MLSDLDHDKLRYFCNVLRYDLEEWTETIVHFPDPSAAMRPMIIQASVLEELFESIEKDAFEDEDSFDDLRALAEDVITQLNTEMITEGDFESSDLVEGLSDTKEECSFLSSEKFDLLVQIAKSKVLKYFDSDDFSELIDAFRS